MDEHVFEDARARLQSKYEFREPDLERACYYMLVSWMGMNGVAGTSSYNSGFCARYTKNGGHAGKRWESAVVSIPAWRRRLRRVTVLRRDAFEVLGRIEDAAGVVIYADPPYIKKGAAYVHDFDGIAHHKLATALNRFKATRVVVSYYEDPWLDRLYPLDRWTRVYCATTKAMVSSGRRDGENIAKAPEVLLINGPSFTAPGA
jgi:DNA adenine methylase